MEDIERTLLQQNVGPDNEQGSGEWPDPDAPPSDVAPGSDPVHRDIIERQRRATVEGGGTTSSLVDRQQTTEPGGDAGPARSAEMKGGNEAEIDPPANYKDALDADPARWGSSSIGEEAGPRNS